MTITRHTEVWKTSDGSFFETEERAKTYEEMHLMTEAIKKILCERNVLVNNNAHIHACERCGLFHKTLQGFGLDASKLARELHDAGFQLGEPR